MGILTFHVPVTLLPWEFWIGTNLSHLPTEVQHTLTRVGIPHNFGFFYTCYLLHFCKLYQKTPKAILFSAASVWKVLRGGCALFSLLGINPTLTFVPKFEHKLRCCSLCPRPPLSCLDKSETIFQRKWKLPPCLRFALSCLNTLLAARGNSHKHLTWLRQLSNAYLAVSRWLFKVTKCVRWSVMTPGPQ